VKVAAATIGAVRDFGVSDPFQMGAAMAPACADTVLTHLRERQVVACHYDLILSGDLGWVGREIAWELLKRGGFDFPKENFLDCGCLLYHPEENGVFAGGSGCGCAAAVGYGHIYRGLSEGRYQRVLLAATGALLSPVANQQRESIPGICHAVALESD
jgi:stage V sporulation protein AD